MKEQRFARLITMKAKRGRGDEFKKAFETEVVPTARRIRGMRRLFLLREVGKKDEFVVVSLWGSRADAERYVRSGANAGYEKKLKEVQSGREKVKKMRVELHTVGASAKK